METFAARLQTAFNALDIDTLRALLADDAVWGDDPADPNTCHNRAEILAQFERLLSYGLRATMVNTTTGPRGVAAALEVEWPAVTFARADRVNFHQVYIVVDGLVTEIQGHGNEASALAAISA